MKAIKFLIAMFFLFVVIIFGTANNDKVTINYWVGKSLLGTVEETKQVPSVDGTTVINESVQVPRQLSLWIVIFACFTCGFLLCYILMLQDVIRARVQMRKSKKSMKKLQSEIDSTPQPVEEPVKEEATAPEQT